MPGKNTREFRFLMPALICGCLLLSGCASTISALHDGPIQQNPGSVSIGTRINDTELETIAEVNIGKASASLKSSHVVPVVFNGNMLLVGQVSSEADKNKASVVAEAIKGITKVYNELKIKPDTAWLVRTSDAWLTTKIKTKMLTTSGLPDSHIKIVTEEGVVYMMGMVSQEVASKAISIATNTGGVQKVVTLFETPKK